MEGIKAEFENPGWGIGVSGGGRGGVRGGVGEGGCFRQGLGGIWNIRDQKRGGFGGVGGEKREGFLVEK